MPHSSSNIMDFERAKKKLKTKEKSFETVSISILQSHVFIIKNQSVDS